MESVIQILEIISAITGLIYIIQASRLKRNCWIYGGISTLIFVFICYNTKLYIDGILNVYYVVMAFVGWFAWHNQKIEKSVTRMGVIPFILFFILNLFLAAIIAYLAIIYTDAASPVLDAIVGAFAITATWLSTRKKIENWFFWWISNSIATVLFFYKELYFYSGLMLVYFILSMVGYVQWKKQISHA